MPAENDAPMESHERNLTFVFEAQAAVTARVASKTIA